MAARFCIFLDNFAGLPVQENPATGSEIGEEHGRSCAIDKTRKRLAKLKGTLEALILDDLPR